ncbi:hypothetical protein GE300_05065 [Rhodobacteraceae bacterium 2CG4]|uniref:Uncharacterized protein n=1 Tax=Halovulum marinum TaxID=2662447 RepID=A0A6L5YYS3_9RHOB|nr:hypothetical protein [Halovulum marinum]MSU88995.1 hypothetical protein [Halovulum marinum]
MTEGTLSEALPDGGRLGAARAVYGRIFRALQDSLSRLESGEETAAEARHRQDLFRAHIKQLQSVFEIEGSIDTLGNTIAAGRIDLEAARNEIRDRLARLRERIAGRGVSGQPE